MRILHINKFFFNKGGSESYYFALRTLLKEHGHTVIDFAMNHEKNEPSPYQKYFTHPVYFDANQSFLGKMHAAVHLLYSLNAAEQLEHLISAEGIPDVAHIHNFSYHLSPSIISVLRRHHIPIVWTLHDYKVISPNYNLYAHGVIDESTKPDRYFAVVPHKAIKDSYIQSLLAATESWLHTKVTGLYHAIDRYIAPSIFMRDMCVSYGIPVHAIKQVYNCIDVQEYTPEYTPGDHYIFVGRFIEEKGIMQLLEAFSGLSKVSLTIIGAGPLEAQMKGFIEAHQLTNVTLLGPVYAPEVFAYIRAAKALIIPSVWYENNPIIMLQAMALGKPIIGARIGGIPELIREGETGLTYAHDNVEALRQAIVTFDTMDVLAMGRAARAFVEQIADKEQHYERIMEVYKEVITEHNKQKKL